MSLVKFNTRPAFNHFFDDFFATEALDAKFNKMSVPAVNVKENDKGFLIEVAAPGLNKEDFNVELEENRLKISSKKETEKVEENEKFTRKEFSYSNFERSFTLPKSIDAKGITGNYESGVLTVSIPKKPEESLTKKISIG